MKRVEQATHYLIRNVEQPFDLETVARACRCSSRTLNEAFQSYLNQSPIKFHRDCRLEAAYAALARNNATVTEAANQFGFENLGRFARAFQERFGHKPSEIPKA
jgi:transcriptional regulator GlxA family with amidase domain